MESYFVHILEPG